MVAWSKTSSAVLMHERHFGESGRGNGQFRLPRHICALPDGNLCISDTVNQRLQVITPEGEFVQSIGKAGSGPGDLRGPSGIACEGGHLYVVEGGNHRLQKLALADGMPVARAGTHGSKKNGELWCPHGVTISKGQAFVADYINGRIVVYDVSNMEHVRTFCSRGSEPGQLEYPCGIAIKGEEVYVAEYGNHRVSVFTKKGVFDRIIGEPGKAPGQFTQPRGLIFVRGWLAVTEPKRVTILSPDGELRQTIELPNAGQLWGACKDEMRMYVTDIRAGQAKVYVLNIIGNSYDDGSSPQTASANAAAQKAAEAAAKLKEWKEARAAGSKKELHE